MEVFGSKYIFFRSMKILLVGHSILDNIEEATQKSIQPGGIFYSTFGINSVKTDNDEVYLITSVNKTYFHLFEKQYKKIHSKYFHEQDCMPEVILKIPPDGERIEIYKNVSLSLPVDIIEDWNQFDGILINMITGFDITLEQLCYIRSNYNGTIYFDVHTLSRGLDVNMVREFRPVPDADRWLRNIDILQCNENELKTISENGSESQAAEWILSFGVKLLIITKAEKGAVCYQKIGKEMFLYFAEAEKVEALNKVGCGDIFGAVFFYSYISNQNIATSLRLASKAGAGAVVSENLISKSKIEL
jgi:sugar/nucleoside kinase (ribokinase family)